MQEVCRAALCPVGADPDMALPGQSFLSRFVVVLSGDRMTLRDK